MNTLFCLFAFFSFHEFYVSTSYMEYNDKKQSIQVQKKIFFDELQKLDFDFKHLKAA